MYFSETLIAVSVNKLLNSHRYRPTLCSLSDDQTAVVEQSNDK